MWSTVCPSATGATHSRNANTAAQIGTRMRGPPASTMVSEDASQRRHPPGLLTRRATSSASGLAYARCVASRSRPPARGFVPSGSQVNVIVCSVSNHIGGACCPSMAAGIRSPLCLRWDGQEMSGMMLKTSDPAICVASLFGCACDSRRRSDPVAHRGRRAPPALLQIEREELRPGKGAPHAVNEAAWAAAYAKAQSPVHWLGDDLRD